MMIELMPIDLAAHSWDEFYFAWLSTAWSWIKTGAKAIGVKNAINAASAYYGYKQQQDALRDQKKQASQLNKQLREQSEIAKNAPVLPDPDSHAAYQAAQRRRSRARAGKGSRTQTLLTDDSDLG